MSNQALSPRTITRQQLAAFFGEAGTAVLRLLPPETAHELGMWLMRRGLLDLIPAPFMEPLTAGMRVNLPGIGLLPHPLGLAAGFDKNCLCPAAFVRMGLSFLEIGTVTPRPQEGNPKPRLFRQADQRALINRMGFNSDGAQTVAARLARLGWRHDQVPLGVNCGKNKQTPPELAGQDFAQVMESFRGLARYFVINVSSPNTPGLRDLATPAFLNELADELGTQLPSVWVKLDPDMQKHELQALVTVMMERGYQGLILSNTHRVVFPEVGGQSGHPLATQSTACLEWAYEVHRGQLPMIGVGGVLSGADVFQKIIRGASAVQLYSALVYRGPWVVVRLLIELAAELKLRGMSHFDDAFASYYRD